MSGMADIIFEIGRYLVFSSVFFFLIFALVFWTFKSASAHAGLQIPPPDEKAEAGTLPDTPGLAISKTVHYLLKRDYQGAETGVRQLSQRYRLWLIFPFYIGVFGVLVGFTLLSLTFGFVLL